MVLQRSVTSGCWLIASATLGLTAVACILLFANKRWRRQKRSPLLPVRDIVLVESELQWATVLPRLIAGTTKDKVLGFDCEWANQRNHVGRVALLQLATTDGLCVILRLNKMAASAVLTSLPDELKDLLADRLLSTKVAYTRTNKKLTLVHYITLTRIVKVGVAPHVDAKKLMADYGLFVQSYLDLGWLATFVLGDQLPSCGLKSLAKLVLDVELDKSWNVRCSDWEAEVLTERQIVYAATDALVSVEIFLALLRRGNIGDRWAYLLKAWLDQPYKHRHCQDSTKLKTNIAVAGASSSYSKMKKASNYGHLVRKNPLKHNCVLQAPDGQTLCTCDVKKVNWYLDKNLADKVSSEPLVVRLKFEPGRRPTSDEEYYIVNKENRCVVCGAAESHIRKNVVPLDYRRHFPKTMKDHKSHDVVLLCIDCHRQSSLSNACLQRRLAEDCDAPLAHFSGKTMEDPQAKRVKSAAKALTTHANSIPETRRQELEAVLCEHFGASEITQEHLFEALELETKVAVTDQNESHAFKVVHKMAETQGLLALERLWRQHFLDAMNPAFMPKLWSVDHGHAMLRARIAVGTDEWAVLFGADDPQRF